MTLRSEIYDAVTGDGTIAGLIGTRCYPNRLPEDAQFPAVVYGQVSEDDSGYRTHDAGTAVARATARIQFSAYAETGDGAAALADALVALWSAYQDGCTIGMAQIANRIETVEPAINRHRHIVDVLMDYGR